MYKTVRTCQNAYFITRGNKNMKSDTDIENRINEHKKDGVRFGDSQLYGALIDELEWVLE